MARLKRLKIGDKVRVVGARMHQTGVVSRLEGRWWWVRLNSKGLGINYPYHRRELEIIEPIIDKDYLELFI